LVDVVLDSWLVIFFATLFHITAIVMLIKQQANAVINNF